MTMAQPTHWRVDAVVRQLDEPLDVLGIRAAAELGLGLEAVVDWQVVRRAIDARGRRAPCFTHSVDVVVREGETARPSPRSRPSPVPEVRRVPRVASNAARPVVIGMGPCGLFAALQLAEAGLKPIVIDRGKAVELRARDVSRLMNKGEITLDSNLCFGEGGAGTWSDGKLYTRVGGPLVREVLESIVRYGGPDRILVDARPHLGTDRLVALLKRFRAALSALGCELRFSARVEELLVRDGAVVGLRLSDGEVIDATHVVLAPGHSARDLYTTLARAEVAMQPKGFAVGFRIEHPQSLIDEIQYGPTWANHVELPAAFYEIAANLPDGGARRGVYSFCMCPGGSVVPTPTKEGEVCVNGMSHAARSGHHANSAVVVQVEPADVAEAARSESPIDQLLAGVAFQERSERLAWEQGGGAFVAPAQRAIDFVQGRRSGEIRRTSYKRGVRAAELSALYPPKVTVYLQQALLQFERQMPGYLSEDAVLIGVETRTSSPVTIVRDRVSLQSLNVAGVYPSGEGAGYGGGIVSAAVDGLRVANAILATLTESTAFAGFGASD